MSHFDTIHYTSVYGLRHLLDCPETITRCARDHATTQPRHERRRLYRRVCIEGETRVETLCELEQDMRAWEKDKERLSMVATDVTGAAWRVCLQSGAKQQLLQSRCACCIGHTKDERLIICDPLARVLYIERPIVTCTNSQ